LSKGSNDLNLLLKAKVVKIKVELDGKGSNLPTQVRNISRSLIKHPVKLKVQLDGKIGDLNKQVKLITNTLNASKGFKPIKLAVQIDVAGSAMNIKSQLQGVYKTVEDFNRKYGVQLDKMQRQTAKASTLAVGATSGKVPMDAGVGNFNNIKQYVNQLKEAERIMKSKLPKGQSGLFSSFEMKDAQGNLKGFIATLERANGVVDKVRYNFNKDKNAFQVIDRTTANNTAKLIDQQLRKLQTLERQIDTTGRQAGQFRTEYNRLITAGATGNLNASEVANFNNKLKESISVTKQREQVVRSLTKMLRETHHVEGLLGQDNIKAVRNLASRATSTNELARAQAELNRMVKMQDANKDMGRREKALRKLKETMMEVSRVTGMEASTIEARYAQLSKSVGGNLGKITQELKKYERIVQRVSDQSRISSLQGAEGSMVNSKNQFSNKKMNSLIASGDVNAMRQYLSDTQKLDIAMMRVGKNANGVTKLTAQLVGTGKTVKQVSFEVDRLSGKLRRLPDSLVFNRNANLGVFEQLKIAMARVPVWMAAMTAFYGTINLIRNMSREILELDKSLTNLRRVASGNINIDTMFYGAIDLSKELGNNIHDVMKSVEELARTFGTFNERQLLDITKTATLMSNVSDLKADEATQTLVGTMNAFNIEASESIRIVDALNEVNISASLYSNVYVKWCISVKILFCKYKLLIIFLYWGQYRQKLLRFKRTARDCHHLPYY